MERGGITKPIYFFEETDGKNRALLGNKGAGLVEMYHLNLPVPPGFIITTEMCAKYYEGGKRLPDGLMDEVRKAIKHLEIQSGKIFGDPSNPLLVSVRSGSPVSMPGMMDTILNLGLNDSTVNGLIKQSGSHRFAWDTYSRFIQMFGKIIYGMDEKYFDKTADNIEYQNSPEQVVHYYKKIIKMVLHREFPSDPYKQLELAIDAVFRSWNGKRAIEYRKRYKITPEMAAGTAAVVVTMVFGNMNNSSATGVVFTRNPETGEKKIYGEYLVNAQGEDVVSGRKTPKIIDHLMSELPDADRQLREVCSKLENYFKEPQDVEFTVENGRLFILQTRRANMNATASVKVSVDLYHEGIIDKSTALSRINAEELEQILYPQIDNHRLKQKPLATGIGASPGAVSGIAIFDVQIAESMGRKGEKVILIREETKPDDVPAFFQSAGILTSRGGKTSHAAVVARGMGKPCVVGCSQIRIDETEPKFTIDGKYEVSQGQQITIDGSTGNIYIGEIPTVKPELSSDLREILCWANEIKTIKIRANADVPESAALSRKYGAEGIGLCRTERMFNQHDRIMSFVKMIMADNENERRQILIDLEILQKSDFKSILKEMQGMPVTIRLLDPPLHEFLPDKEELFEKLFELKAKSKQIPDNVSEINRLDIILKRVHELSEVNPMLGHRGVRMGISFPEIYETQIRALCEATADLARDNIQVEPQVMVPQVGMTEELVQVRRLFETVKREVENKYKIRLNIKFGSMIEVVRSCLIADEIADIVDFMSFGTNDLTQAVFSFSREDAESKFLPTYIEKGMLGYNPFQIIDTQGVGKLMRIAMDLAKRKKKNIEVGICGEHGGDPRSIAFCSELGLDYVSASSHRIPIAIISAAQSAIRKDTLYKST